MKKILCYIGVHDEIAIDKWVPDISAKTLTEFHQAIRCRRCDKVLHERLVTVTAFPQVGERVSITVERTEPLSGNRWKIKVKETQINLIDLDYEGKRFVVVKNYGRGRYVMKLVGGVSEVLDKEWEALDKEGE